LPSKLCRNNFPRRNPSRVELLNPPQLIRLQPRRIALYVSDC
jgi:hypothetical protein